MLRTASISHQSAPVEFRERVWFSNDEIVQSIRELVLLPSISEAAILSTCNRTEIYLVTHESFDICEWLSHEKGIPYEELNRHMVYRNDGNAVRHIFRVASSLDSIIIGESQILGQLKKAASISQSSNGCGTVLHRLFHYSFSTAKEVRSSTGIGRNVISTAACAAYLVEKSFAPIKEQRVLFVGGGEIISLCMTHFKSRSPKSIGITNRTEERIAPLIAKFNASKIPFDTFGQHLHEYDVIVSGIISSPPIISDDMVSNAISKRQGKPIIMIDLSVPRSIEPGDYHDNHVKLYTIDDLSRFVTSSFISRCSAIQEAEKIVDKNLTIYLHWLTTRSSAKIIKTLREKNYHIAVQEGQRAVRKLGRGVPSEIVIQDLCQKIVNKILHHPTMALRDNIRLGDKAARDMVAKIFDIEKNT
ncbi:MULTISPECIES: glutamyl-tRNA reductase [Candidatus Ichthyocystis]|uniref:glutamyl-tRNA reductase n=1 Tax=Candidatus Ichthyocystis TaxID=2929841 RepID=UPI000A75A9E8|nr:MULTISPECIES: glutamyl-tRNA reductase [Ichthyocystis]